MMSSYKKLYLIITFICLYFFSLSYSQVIHNYTSETIKISGENNNQFLGETVVNIGKSLNSQNYLIGIGAPAENSDAGAFYIFSDITYSGDFDSSTAIKQVTGSVTARLGKTVGSFGDIDKDNQNDLIFISPSTEQLFILLGKNIASYQSQDDMVSLTINTTIIENANTKYVGNQIDIAGDINGDQYDDILIGGPKNTTSFTNNNGRGYIIFGRDSFDSLSNGNVNTDADIILEGTHLNGHTGYSVDILPDINQDGYDEVLISSFDQLTTTGYKTYLIYGKPSFSHLLSSKTFDLNNADAIFSYSHPTENINFGETVKGIGDLNGDGYNEFAITGPAENHEKIFIFFGSETPLSGHIDVETAANVIISGDNTYFFGLHSIQGEFDLNGDGYDDLAISEFLDPGISSDMGSVYIFYGSATFNTLGSSLQSSDADVIIQNSLASNTEKIGISLANLYDQNNNGIDEILIGSIENNATNLGQARVFELNSKSSPTPTGGTLSFFSDDTYTTPLTTTARQENIYVMYQENPSNDVNSNEKNILHINADSPSSHKTLQFKLFETGNNSGLYKGTFIPVQTRTSHSTKQLKTNLNDTITLKLEQNATITNTFQITNAPPKVEILELEQIGTLNNTTVAITFKLTDYDGDNCNFTHQSSQLQYSINNGINWFNGTILGTSDNLASSDQEINHSIGTHHFTWTTANDIGQFHGTIQMRLKAQDGTILGDYSPVADVNLDNLAPAPPVIVQPTLNYAYSFTLNGTGEAHADIHIFKNDSFVSSANINENGHFSIENITVSNETDIIYAKTVDSFGFVSPKSNEITIPLNNYSTQLTDGNLELSLNIPLGVANNAEPISLTNLGTVNESPPNLYSYIDIFDLTYGTSSYTEFNIPVTVNTTLTTPLTTTNGVAVYYFNTSTQEWETTGITVEDVTTTHVTFSTSHFSIFAIVQLTDPFFPTISDMYINNSIIAADHYYPKNFVLTSILSDEHSSISTWKIDIFDTNTDELITTYEENNISEQELDITFSPSQIPYSLNNGNYTLKLSATDEYGNQQSKSNTIKINEDDFIFSALHAPNPYNPNNGPLTFSYNSSQSLEEFHIIIFNQSQQKVWEFSTNTLSSGYYLVEWNGQYEYGDTVPNGIYYAYCIAKTTNKTKKKILKIAVLR